MSNIRKGLLLLISALALIGCATQGKPSVYSMITLPAQNTMIILGASGRQLSHTDEIEIAREEAARKASMYHGVTASAIELLSIGSGYLDYTHDSFSWVDYEQPFENFTERLSFDEKKDVYRDNNGNIFIRFSYPVAFPANIDYRFERTNDDRPLWVNHPPSEISGFMAGVGRSGRLDKFADTFRASFEAAAITITSRISTYIGTDTATVKDQSETQIYRQSIGRLTNFMVLETWIEPKTRAVYTLAIAQPANSTTPP